MAVRYSKESAGPSTRRVPYEMAPDPVEQGDPGDYGEMTKAELQEELEKRGLPTSGNKDELVERLAG